MIIFFFSDTAECSEEKIKKINEIGNLIPDVFNFSEYISTNPLIFITRSTINGRTFLTHEFEMRNTFKIFD